MSRSWATPVRPHGACWRTSHPTSLTKRRRAPPGRFVNSSISPSKAPVLLRGDRGDPSGPDGRRADRLHGGWFVAAFAQGAVRAVRGVQRRRSDGEDDEAVLRGTSWVGLRVDRRYRYLHARLGPCQGNGAVDGPEPCSCRTAVRLCAGEPSRCARGPEPKPFGPAIDVAAGAPAADRLAGYLGRRP